MNIAVLEVEKAKKKKTLKRGRMRAAKMGAVEHHCEGTGNALAKMDGERLVKTLAWKALDGELSCVQMLYRATASKSAGKERKADRVLPSMAEIWAAEPEWEEELSEETAETRLGSREPEE